MNLVILVVTRANQKGIICLPTTINTATQLLFRLPPRYPDEIPEMTIQRVSGVSEAALKQFLEKRAKAHVGSEMVSGG